jgi:BirA family transcriptional regulator, biotin operon repressor / biotin---[acetyl-CoA-carboxylase] ligase
MAVALGANAGDRTAALVEAVLALRGMGSVRAVSPLYETPAEELPAGAEAADRAPYLNAVARLETDLPAEAVLAACLACEAALGRDRARERRHGARVLDMDLLLCDREVRDGAFLRLPHPRMGARSFVLVPLAAAWPDAPRPQAGPWPRWGAGEPGGPRVVADAGWADAALQAEVPAPASDLCAERERRSALGRPPLYLFGELGSTADVLRHLAAAGAPHGTTVVAERQRAGRGRHGRAWWAPPYESLLVSVLVRDGDALGGLLPLLVGLAVAESVEAAGGGRLLLKWPNDVIARDGRKAAGVLVERTGAGAALVGIGINMAPPGTWAPPAVAARAASLADVGEVPARDILLRHLSARLLTLAAEARERRPGVLLERWRVRAPMLGRPVSVHVLGGGRTLSGIAQGLAADGALVVRQADGSERRVHAGEVTLSPAWREVAASGEHRS